MKAFVFCFALVTVTGCASRQLRPERSLSGQTTLVGCVSRSATSGEFLLTDRRDAARKTRLTGHPDLERLANNHAVRVVGMWNRETAGEGLKVVRVEHLAASCAVPF